MIQAESSAQWPRVLVVVLWVVFCVPLVVVPVHTGVFVCMMVVEYFRVGLTHSGVVFFMLVLVVSGLGALGAFHWLAKVFAWLTSPIAGGAGVPFAASGARAGRAPGFGRIREVIVAAQVVVGVVILALDMSVVVAEVLGLTGWVVGPSVYAFGFLFIGLLEVGLAVFGSLSREGRPEEVGLERGRGR